MFFQNFLRPFREHHIDPTSITRHDFVETNGDNFAITIPVLARIVWQLLTYDNASIEKEFHWISYWYLCCIFVAMTNQVKSHGSFYFSINTLIFNVNKLLIGIIRDSFKEDLILFRNIKGHCSNTLTLNSLIDA